MKKGIESLSALAAEIERRAKAKEDLVTSTENLEVVTVVSAPPAGTETDFVDVQLKVGDDRKYPINKIAHNQLATYTDIPQKYYDRMLVEAPGLLADNVNKWLHKGKSENRLVRTLDGRARAFLSDRYRPLENEDLAEAVLPVLLELDLAIMSMQITESRFYLKVVDKSVEREVLAKGGKFGDGKHNIVRVLAPALTISNSEVGQGALSVLGGVYDGFCTNLATFGERSARKYHVGAKHDLATEATYALLSDETRRKTDEAVWAQIKDVVKGAFERASFDALVDKIAETTEQKIGGDPVKVVTLTAKRFGMTEGEGKSVLRNLIEGGDLTRFGLYNAVTRTAEDLESYDRATEFEATGGKIIDLPETEWRVLAEAA